jgi:hypothetical protein
MKNRAAATIGNTQKENRRVSLRALVILSDGQNREHTCMNNVLREKKYPFLISSLKFMAATFPSSSKYAWNHELLGQCITQSHVSRATADTVF